MSNVITVSDSSLLRTKEKGTFGERVNSLFNELGIRELFREKMSQKTEVHM